MNTALQQAIYTTLTGDAPLMAVLVAVYDDVPQAADSAADSAFPYVTVGAGVLGAWVTDDWSGGEAVIRLHTWSRYRGFKQTKQIQDLIKTALDRVSFTITGYSNVDCQFESDSVSLDPDGRTRHGVSEYRINLN